VKKMKVGLMKRGKGFHSPVGTPSLHFAARTGEGADVLSERQRTAGSKAEKDSEPVEAVAASRTQNGDISDRVAENGVTLP